MRKHSKLQAPIILIGAARSGTTMLGDILSKHPDIAYWVEPKYIWKVNNPNIKNDIRTKEEATPKIKHYIHHKFLNFQTIHEKSRFLEKTPSNCFRIPFIQEVFEDAVYINIVRDGRDVTLSAYKKWTQKHDKSAYRRRVKLKDFPLPDLPSYSWHFGKQIIGQQLWPNRLNNWGPMTPEIAKYSKKSVEEACAFQWKQSTEYSLKELDKLSSSKVFSFKYEDFIKEPGTYLKNIFDHCGLAYSEKAIEYAEKITRPNNSKKWEKEENKERMEKVNYLLDPLLKKLEYL